MSSAIFRQHLRAKRDRALPLVRASRRLRTEVARAGVLVAAGAGVGLPVAEAVVGATLFRGVDWAIRLDIEKARFLLAMRAGRHLVAPLATVLLLMALGLSGVLPSLTPLEAMLLTVAAVGQAVLPLRGDAKVPPRRVAVIGGHGVSADLAAELHRVPRSPWSIIGYVLAEGAEVPSASSDRSLPCVGQQGAVAEAVREHGIDLLLVAPGVPRMALFEEIAQTCLDRRVRVMELTAFYEEAFGHVPLSAINAAWFQYVVHPRFHLGVNPTKRLLDLVVAGVAAVVFAPVLLMCALLIRRDGGPVFYRQTRIGEGGRPFQILKLRSMRVASPDAEQRWSSANDDRVTGVGRFIRRTHIDEVPQVLNVLRGDMSIVGPRPEQPKIIDELERAIPYYTRRHLARPGVTGWAQVQCGYAGSVAGSAFKVCHDLYYVKHRSFLLDLLILAETVRTLVADRQWPIAVEDRTFVVPPPADTPVAA
jgi:exopolysaccharide biosynthesis polyprenyl glycosylphosphotransferase